MRLIRFVLAFSLLVMLLTFSGCLGKSYYYNFTTEDDMSRDDGDWWVEHPETLSINSNGLITYGSVFTPFSFTGNLDVIVEFTIDTSNDSSTTMAVILSNFNGLCPWTDTKDNLEITIRLPSIYDESPNYYYQILTIRSIAGIEQVITDIVPGTAPVPGLRVLRSNVLRISKNGDIYSVYLNGVSLIKNFNITTIDLTKCCIQLAEWDFQADINASAVVFKDIQVLYDGTEILWNTN